MTTVVAAVYFDDTIFAGERTGSPDDKQGCLGSRVAVADHIHGRNAAAKVFGMPVLDGTGRPEYRSINGLLPDGFYNRRMSVPVNE